jgi:hypothetical protein
MKALLKLAVVGLALVWALYLPPMTAQTNCTQPQYGQCMNSCGNTMGACANSCYGNMACINACYANFTSCQGSCTSQYCQSTPPQPTVYTCSDGSTCSSYNGNCCPACSSCGLQCNGTGCCTNVCPVCTTPPYAQCMNRCSNAMGACASSCYQGNPACISNCYSQLVSCQSSCNGLSTTCN